MAICSKCLHKEVCAYRKQTRDSCAESCGDFLGLVKVMDERPIPLKDNIVISNYGLSFIGYYDYNKRDREHFYDVNALEKIYECPSYWLKGLELHEQEKIANKEYECRKSNMGLTISIMILTKKFKLFQRNLSHFMASQQSLLFIVMMMATVWMLTVILSV